MDAVLSLGTADEMNLRHVGIKKVAGGGVTESQLVRGVAFKKTFSYAGFEQMTKKFKDPKILALNVELELKSEKENAEIRIEDPSQYQSIVDAEWKIIYSKLELCVSSGANIILSRLPIGDLATQYFADRGLFCAGRVNTEDLERVSRATGAKIQTSVNGITAAVLGTCGNFEEQQVGSERFNMFTDCTDSRTSTLILRGGADQFLEESHRSVWDALNVVKRCIQNNEIVAGGGAIEMEVSKVLREYARTIPGKEQLIINAYAKVRASVLARVCSSPRANTIGAVHSNLDADLLLCVVSVISASRWRLSRSNFATTPATTRPMSSTPCARSTTGSSGCLLMLLVVPQKSRKTRILAVYCCPSPYLFAVCCMRRLQSRRRALRCRH